MNKTPFDLVIFDMDGTLVDSMGCLEDWLYRAVKAECPPSLMPAHISAAFGPTEQKIIEKFVPAGRVTACLNAYYDLYEAEHGRVYIYPGINELLRQLQLRGVPLALCTGKSRRAVEITLDILGWEDRFKFIVTGDDTVRFKPDPEGLNLILAKFKTAPSRTIFIGDSAADIVAADSAGVLSGHAQWGHPAPLPAGTPPPTYTFFTPQAVPIEAKPR